MAETGIYPGLIHMGATAARSCAVAVACAEFGGMPLRRMRQKWLAGFMPHGWFYA